MRARQLRNTRAYNYNVPADNLCEVTANTINFLWKQFILKKPNDQVCLEYNASSMCAGAKYKLFYNSFSANIKYVVRVSENLYFTILVVIIEINLQQFYILLFIIYLKKLNIFSWYVTAQPMKYAYLLGSERRYYSLYTLYTLYTHCAR